MAIDQLTDTPQLGRHPILDEFGITPTLTVRLGVKARSKKDDTEYPEEVDHFVLSEADGATPEVLAAYGRAPKRLWVFLPFEAPIPNVPHPDDDKALAIYNMAWGWNSGMLCKGTGRSQAKPGMAYCTDERFHQTIIERIGAQSQRTADGGFLHPCLGADCPQYRRTIVVPEEKNGRVRQSLKMAPGHFPNAPCKFQVTFQAMLLDPKDPDPKNVLAVMKVTSGSIYSIKGLIDGLNLMRRFTRSAEMPQGRTALIPFRIVRKPTWTTKVARRQHHTIAVDPTPAVWQRWAPVSADRAFMSVEAYEELRGLLAAEATLNDVRDIIPRPLELAAHAGEDLTEIEAKVHAPTVPQGTLPRDPDDVIDGATRPAEPDPGSDDYDPLSEPARPDQVRALKDLLGGREDPDDPSSPMLPDTKVTIRQWINQYHQTKGTPPIAKFSELTVGHVKWITERVTGASWTEDGHVDGEADAAAAAAPANGEEQPPLPTPPPDAESATRGLGL